MKDGTTQALLNMLEGAELGKRLEAERALVCLGVIAVEPLTTVMLSGVGRKSYAAARVLAIMMQESEAVAELTLTPMTEALKLTKPALRQAAAQILGEVGDRCAVELIEALKDEKFIPITTCDLEREMHFSG
jgi:hypothetical protein